MGRAGKGERRRKSRIRPVDSLGFGPVHGNASDSSELPRVRRVVAARVSA